MGQTYLYKNKINTTGTAYKDSVPLVVITGALLYENPPPKKPNGEAENTAGPFGFCALLAKQSRYKVA